MSTEWIVRAYCAEDEQQTLQLYEEAFGKSRAPDFQRWKFWDSPARNTQCGIYVAATEDRIIGQFGGVAQFIKLGDSQLTIMQGCDVLTAADFRKRGVLASVGRETFDAWTAAGIDYCIGLENKAWGSRVELLNLRPCLRTSTMSIQLRPDRILARRLGLPDWIANPLNPYFNWRNRRHLLTDKTVGVRAIGQPEQFFDLLWQILQSQVYAGVRRDAAWLQYRYLSAPRVDYRILFAADASRPFGYICYRIIEKGDIKTGVVVDLFADWTASNTMDSLISAMIDDMSAAGVDTITLPLVAHPPTIRAFERFGFSRKKGYTVVVIPLARPDLDPDMCDPQRWFVMPGDFDIV